jgi:hypothetical protein
MENYWLAVFAASKDGAKKPEQREPLQLECELSHVLNCARSAFAARPSKEKLAPCLEIS